MNEAPEQSPLEPLRRVHSDILGVERVEFDDCKDPAARRRAEIEAMRDLLKPHEQLLADVHEEAENNPSEIGRLAGATKRMVSLQVRVVRSNNRLSQQMLWLTWAIAAMTAAILWLTWVMAQQQPRPATPTPAPTTTPQIKSP